MECILMNQSRGLLRSAAGSSQCESVRAWSDLRRCSGGEGAVGERVPPSRTLNFSQLLSILDQKQYCVNKHCELTGKRLKYCRVCPGVQPKGSVDHTETSSSFFP